MVSAGLTTHLTQMAGLNGNLPVSASLADRISEDVQRGLIRASVRAGVTTAIQGGSLDKNLVFALRSEAASVIGENVAQEIGSAYHGGDINKATQLIAHAALGCATGSIAGGDCTGGAVGGVAGEVASELFVKNWANSVLRRAQSGELTREELAQEMASLEGRAINVAAVSGALAAAFAGGDVNSGADAGSNAAENNALCAGFCIAGVILAAGALYSTVVGEGDPLDGLEKIGNGSDPLSEAIASGVSSTIELSMQNFPETTLATLEVLEAVGEAKDVFVSYVDDQTGNVVSAAWNDLPQSTQDRIKGGITIASFAIPAGAVTKLRNLKSAKVPTVRTSGGTANALTAAQLNRKLLLDEVVDHSFYKHVLQQGEFQGLGIRTVEQFRRHVDNVIENPSSIRYYNDGRSVFLQESTGTVVVRNPTGSGQSTAFQPRDWGTYISGLPKQTTPPQ